MEDSERVMQAAAPIFIDEQVDLSRYDLILTPNQRLSVQLSSVFDEQQIKSNKLSWQPLPVHSISNWLLLQWNSASQAGLTHSPARILSSDEELELWRQTVDKCHPELLLARESTAQQLMQAWQMLANWCLTLDNATRSQFSFFEDHMFFLQCVDCFESICKQQQALPAQQIPGMLAKLPAKHSQRVLLYEFDELVPAHEHLLNAWGYQIEHANGARIDTLKSSASDILAIQTSRVQEELLAAATWARTITDEDEHAKVAVIVPDLSSNRALVHDIFSQVFSPGYELPHAVRQPPKFNISAGQSLASQPMVEHALAVLELNFHELQMDAFTQLIYSPFLASLSADSLNDRSELEYSLRNYRSRSLSLGTLHFEASATKPYASESVPRCSNMAKAISAFQKLTAGIGQLPVNEWLLIFDRQLQCCGWPGDRTLDSVEFQQYEHWQDALTACVRMAAIRYGEQSKLSGFQCFELLSQSCREHVFQAKSEPCQVQVLGLLEGAGLQFSHTWLTSMGDRYWPAPARPSAYLPLDFQREHRLPHCDAERELQFSGRLFANYRSHCSQLVLSYVDRDGDAMAPPSPFLVANATETKTFEPSQLRLHSSGVKESYQLESHLPISESENFAAVASIYEDQASCGFKAFVRHRLRLRAPKQATYGLDGAERGILLHDSMESVWRELGDRITLLVTEKHDLHQVVARSIETAMQSAAKRVRFRDSAVFLELERSRLQDLIVNWLTLEAEREEFSVVDFEVSITTRIANREAHLRIDRVDRKRDGKLVLIEYKTGIISESGLLSDPLLAPQLPLYLSSYQAAPETSTDVMAAGGVLCRVDALEPAWLGLGDGAEDGLPRTVKQCSGKVPEWQELRSYWQSALAQLDAAFSEGQVSANPAKGQQTCRLCDYSNICRYNLDGDASATR